MPTKRIFDVDFEIASVMKRDYTSATSSNYPRSWQWTEREIVQVEPFGASGGLPTVDMGRMRLDGIQVGLRHSEYSHDIELRVVLVGCLDVRKNEPHLSPTMLNHRFTRDHWDSASEDDRAQMIRRQIMRALEHEVDEWLKVDGKQVTDPHLHEKRFATGKP